MTLTAPLTKAHAASAAASYFDPRGLAEYRALMDKYSIQAGGTARLRERDGWADTVAAGKILGADQLGSGGTPPRASAATPTCSGTAGTANRLGKSRSRTASAGVYIHNHQQESRSRYIDNGVLKTAWQIYMERIDARYAAAEIDAPGPRTPMTTSPAPQTTGLIDQFPTKVKLLHIKDGVNVAPRRTAGGVEPARVRPAR